MESDRSTTGVVEPAWIPPAEVIERANVTAACSHLGLADYPALHRWSVENREAYWELVIARLGVRFRRSYERIVDVSQPTRPRWLVGASMNIVDSCFQADDGAAAVIESDGGGPPRVWTCRELRRLTARVAAALVARGVRPGDAVAMITPMTARSVAVYLGAVASGAAVVSIADSFAAEEIAVRLRVGGAKWAVTQDVVRWGGKRLPLYEKVAAAGAPPTIVLAAEGAGTSVALRDGDVTFDAFLDGRGKDDGPFDPVAREPHDVVNVLFSSGTTGEPKAIPWDHTTPLKCAADAHFHHDLHAGDVACWPTSLGWMMGPWLIFAALLNRAAMALYVGAPADAAFGTFVRDAGVTMLGVVPSLVRAWRQSGRMAGVDWRGIRAFSSTGECSNPDDARWLMASAGGRPLIEYCGGTEVGGGYVTGTVVQPCAASAFSTPALGLDFVLLDEAGRPADRGEAFIVGPSIGLSTRLLNRDHDAVYFDGAPAAADGPPLRRHGDELERLAGGYHRVAGRCDDTMNLGGIKVGCAEIERVVCAVAGVREAAAVAVPPAGGGPSRLVVFVVAGGGQERTAGEWKEALQRAIRDQLNPLFHVHEVCPVESLPRTASNKVMRRELRGRVAGA